VGAVGRAHQRQVDALRRVVTRERQRLATHTRVGRPRLRLVVEHEPGVGERRPLVSNGASTLAAIQRHRTTPAMRSDTMLHRDAFHAGNNSSNNSILSVAPLTCRY
jgi:hypothetical protein